MMPALSGTALPVSATQLPVTIDYPAALALRQMALVQDELPKYLLAPEVSALLHYVPDLHRKMLLATLWNTGARINEALALTRGDFSLAPPYPFVQLATLKQRAEKAARTAGRVPAGSQTHRLVPLSDSQYVSQLQMMVATLKIPLERKNKRTGRTEKARIWDITDRTVRTWIKSQRVSVYSVTTVKKDALKNIIKDVEKRGYSTSTADLNNLDNSVIVFKNRKDGEKLSPALLKPIINKQADIRNEWQSNSPISGVVT